MTVESTVCDRHAHYNSVIVDKNCSFNRCYVCGSVSLDTYNVRSLLPVRQLLTDKSCSTDTVRERTAIVKTVNVNMLVEPDSANAGRVYEIIDCLHTSACLMTNRYDAWQCILLTDEHKQCYINKYSKYACQLDNMYVFQHPTCDDRKSTIITVSKQSTCDKLVQHSTMSDEEACAEYNSLMEKAVDILKDILGDSVIIKAMTGKAAKQLNSYEELRIERVYADSAVNNVRCTFEKSLSDKSEESMRIYVKTCDKHLQSINIQLFNKSYTLTYNNAAQCYHVKINKPANTDQLDSATCNVIFEEICQAVI